MFKKNHTAVAIEFIVNILFYPVLIVLSLMLVVIFSKQITEHCVAQKAAAKQSIVLPVITSSYTSSLHNVPVSNSSNIDISENNEIAPEEKPVYVVPCHVIVVDEPIPKAESAETETCEVEDVSFSVPLSDDVQSHIFEICNGYEIDPALVIALIQRESNYNSNALGDGGTSEGLMQIKREYHGERMARLGCYDLLDPKQNVAVGIDFLAELLNTYDTVEMALMVYNAGATGANTYWFSQGIYSTEYSREILATMAELYAR